jgi:hypothetical protein
MKARRLVVGTLVLASVVVLPACATNIATQENLCTRYDNFVSAVDALKNADLKTPQLDALRAKADAVNARLDELQAVAEGQLDTMIATLQSDLADLRAALASAGGKAREAVQPVLQQQIDNIEQAFAQIEARAGVDCSSH